MVVVVELTVLKLWLRIIMKAAVVVREHNVTLNSHDSELRF